LGNPTEEKWPGWKDMKYASKVSLNKKHKQNTLRFKIPALALSKDDPMFLSDKGLDLMQKMFAFDSKKRISAEDALKHEWFSEEPLCATEMPSFATDLSNEISRD
jgi:cell division cycle 2-like protein